MGGNGSTFWERILGTHMRPSERKLLMMKNDAIQYLKKNPKALAELKRVMEEVRAKNGLQLIKTRITRIPDPIGDCLKRMDNTGMPTETRALTSMIIFQIDGVIEEIDEVE
jgi:hypothetical protein